MPVERAAGGTSLIDVRDRVLDKGIGIDASIDTYLKYSEAVSQVTPVSRPQAELTTHQNVIAENAALRAELAATKATAAATKATRTGRRRTASEG